MLEYVLPNSKLSFSVKVKFSFRTNIIQRKVLLSYRLVSIQTTNCFLLCHVKWDAFTELSFLQLQIGVALGICLLSCQVEMLSQFLLHLTGHLILFLLTCYILHEIVVAHVIIFFFVFFIILPFWEESLKTVNIFLMNIKQIEGHLNQDLLPFPSQWNPGCAWSNLASLF